MTKKDIKLLRKYAFSLVVTSYRRLYLTYLGQRVAYLRCFLNEYLDLAGIVNNDVDYEYALNQYHSILKLKNDRYHFILIYSTTCKALSERIKKYGVFDFGGANNG